MISLTNISKQYGGKYLFNGISMRFGDRERVAIVGSNGAGKTTLMKILIGTVDTDSGEIAQSRGNTVGYLPQEGVYHSGKTVFDEAATAFDDLVLLHDRVDDISRSINVLSAQGVTDSPELHELIDELGEIQHVLEHREGYTIETKISQVLSGLGFRERDYRRLTDEFSSGWQMRIALAKLLLQEPSLLLLDEPTNHLDIEALEWLEQYLKDYEGTLILISHDRRFLDTVVQRTVEVTLGKVNEYSGNYSFYIDEKVRRTEQLQAEFDNQKQKIKQTMQFVERFRYKSTKARQVQSRLKMLEKLDLIEIEDEEKGISFDFPVPPAPGRTLLELTDVSKSYGEIHVFKDLSMTVERDDRIAMLGVNGVGKSTLARIIAGVESFQSGARKAGHNVLISYYAQDQAEELDPNKTVLQTLDDVATGDVRRRLRTLLGCFLFSGDDVFKYVSVLSGGEKSRLALAKMLIMPANLLVLDEPTNHLDIRSKTVLQEALLNFEGSYIIVSHDRDFLDPIITKCLDFQDGKLRTTLGSVSDYLSKRHDEQSSSMQRNAEAQAMEKKSLQHLEKERKRDEAARRQDRYQRTKPLKNQILRVEKQIAEKEAAKAHVESLLGMEDTYKLEEKARELTAQYKSLTTELAYLYDEWARLQEQMDSVE